MGVLNPTVLEGLDVSHAMCAPACALFDLPDVHVLTIERHRSSFTLVVETVPSLVGCPACGVLAVGHGRVAVLLHDIAKGRGGDHSVLGEEVARKLCPRLGFSEAETAMSWQRSCVTAQAIARVVSLARGAASSWTSLKVVTSHAVSWQR